MKWFFRARTRVCGPERFFEELESRIVLDASVDASGHDHPLGHHDFHGQFTAGARITPLLTITRKQSPRMGLIRISTWC